MWKPPIETQTQVSHIQSCCPFFQSDLVNEAKKIVSFKTDVWKWREFWGKSEFHRIFSSTLDIVAYHIWAFLVAARGSRSRGHFWYLARCRISVFQILPLGGAKLFSLDIILEEICILFSHSWQNIGGEYTFLSRYMLVVLWNFIPVKCQRRSPQTRFGFSKDISRARVR